MSKGVTAVLVLLAPAVALAQAADVAAPEVNLPTVNIIGSSPLLGSGLDRNKLPAATNVLNSGDISRDGTPNAVRALDEQVGGVNLDSASGNPDQPTLLYHGFEVSPLQGTPQGLAVYVNGARFNDAFGDTVNWDLIPSIAIGQLNLEGPNPVFGLNALGRIAERAAQERLHLPWRRGGSLRRFVRPDRRRDPVRQAGGRRQHLRRRHRAASGWLARPAILRHPEFLRRYRLARRPRRGAPGPDARELGAERPRHGADRVAGRRPGGAVHGAERDRQPLRGGEPARQLHRIRYDLDPGARLLPLPAAAGRQRQRRQRRTLRRRVRAALRQRRQSQHQPRGSRDP